MTGKPMNDATGTSRKANLLREVGKALGVLAILVLLMLWLSGAFISKVEPGPPLTKASPEPFNKAKVERRTFP